MLIAFSFYEMFLSLFLDVYIIIIIIINNVIGVTIDGEDDDEAVSSGRFSASERGSEADGLKSKCGLHV